MSSFSDFSVIKGSIESCFQSAVKALVESGFQIESKSEKNVLAVEGHKGSFSFTNPAKVFISVEIQSELEIKVTFSGSNFGFGPIQSRHVKDKVNEVRQKFLALLASSGSQPFKETGQKKSVIINGGYLSQAEMEILTSQFSIQFYEGNFWYDHTSGAWGYLGGPTAGYLLPNLPIDHKLKPDASSGLTGVFINGRQLPLQDLFELQQVFPHIFSGWFWLDAFGNLGIVGGSILGNIRQIRQSNSSGSRKSVLTTWDKTGGAVIGGEFLER